MTRDFITFTRTFNTSDTTSTTLPNSYQNFKAGVISEVKTQIIGLGLGFTVLSEGAPLATAAAQTINIMFNSTMVCNESGNWIMRIQLAFGAFNSPANLTIRADFMRSATPSSAVVMQLFPIATISAWTTNPTEIHADINSVLAGSTNIFAAGVRRANFLLVSNINLFPANMFSMFRYKVLSTGDMRWGGLSSSVNNNPLQTILAPAASVLTPLAVSAQTQFGFMNSATGTWQCLSMPSVYWNETVTLTTPLLFSMDADPEILFVTAPATGTTPSIPQSTIVNIAGSDYWIVNIFLGKMALVKITV